MKAWRFDHYGGPQMMTLEERPLPVPGHDEVLIKVAATGINPSDVKTVKGHFNSSLPRVPGRDFAGIIVSGAGREGEAVWGSAPGFGVGRDGTHCEYIVMPSAWAGRKPARLGADGVAVDWNEVPADKLHDTLAAASPVCFACHMANTLVREHPELAVDRARPKA